MGCATAVVRIIMFVFNLVFALGGLGLLILGVLYKLNVTEITDVVPDQLEVAPTLLIIVGCIVFAISFFGCCGAVRESTCMLTTYAVILLVLFLLQVAVGVYAFLQIKDTDSLKEQVRTGMSNVWRQYSNDPVARETVDVIQRNNHCCGVTSTSDAKFTNGSYTMTCCKVEALDRDICHQPSFTTVCVDIIFDNLVSVVRIIGIVAISIAVTEILGSIAALCLSSSIKNQYRRGAYA